MKHIKTGTKRDLFSVLASTRSAQAAMMTLRPGQSTGEAPENEHPSSEQWLFVVSGVGRARVGRKRSALRSVFLRESSLLLIEKAELHQITNTGRALLVTLNFYAPPAYTPAGDPREE